METLLQLSLSAGTVLEPEQHARQALARLVSLLRCDRGILLLASEEGRLRPAAAFRLGHFVALDQPYSRPIVRKVAETREPVRVVDAMTDPRFPDRSSVTESGLRSILCLPLLAQNRLVGVLYLDHRFASGLFKDGDLGGVSALANHIAQALETSRAAQLESHLAAERRERELADILLETNLSLSATLDSELVLDRLVEGLARVVPHEASERFVGEPDGAAPDWAASCLASGEPVLEGAVLSVPMVREGLAVGALRLTREEGEFAAREGQLAFLFASQAGWALENARLFGRVQELASVDQLTGVWNRRHLLEMAEQVLKSARRAQRPLTLILLDIDHFKKFNDTHGHLVGDQVLRGVARCCRQTLRESDLFGRYGGEEFVAVLPETGPEGAAETAERLATAIRHKPLQTESGEPLRITISQGLASAPLHELEALLMRADQALYAAKDAGRDCFKVG